MMRIVFLKIKVLALVLAVSCQTVIPCSMYKVTLNGKTMVGNNEDSWGRDARIWFEKGKDGKFGVVCVGYARKQPHPDGAMNEHGLAFDAFTMRRKSNMPEKDASKKDFAYSHIKTIMQECKTVDEVYAFLSKLNLHILNGSPIFNGGMFLFVDKTGKYLVVEANKLSVGNDVKFVLANFSFADTKDFSTITMERYCKGVEFLSNKALDSNLQFYTDLLDTMSVSRSKVGDGTLYTNIYDLNSGLIHLFFYHDFSKRVSLNIKEELAKGDHSYDFVELFPGNKNFQKFLDYKTPQNNKTILIFIIVCGILFLFSALFYLKSFFRSTDTHYRYLKLVMSILSICMFIYAFILIRNQSIYYFPSPYSDGSSILVSLSSYLPFVLLLSIIPLLFIYVKIIRQQQWKGLSKWLLLTNSFAYIVLIGLFAYWRLFDVFA